MAGNLTQTEFRENIRKNLFRLKSEIDSRSVVPKLREKGVLTKLQADDTEDTAKRFDKNEQLLNILYTRPTEEIPAILDSFRETKQEEIARMLTGQVEDTQVTGRPLSSGEGHIVETLIKLLPPVPGEPLGHLMQPEGLSPVDLELWNRCQKLLSNAEETRGLLDFVIAPVGSDSKDLVRAKEGREVYKSNHPDCKGFALIINNNEFTKAQERQGSDVDCVNANKLFKDLGYETEVKCNLTKEGMEDAVRSFASKDFHKYSDSAVVVIMTHGGPNDTLEGIDGDTTTVAAMVDLLKPKAGSRNALSEKPKLFFIQACRGGKEDPGFSADSARERILSLSVVQQIYNMLRPPNYQYIQTKTGKLPSDSDILIAFATTPGYKAYRDHKKGSWFIQALCEIFSEHAKDTEIISMLTKVNNRIASAYKTNGKGMVQMSEQHTRLRKEFYFFPAHKK